MALAVYAFMAAATTLAYADPSDDAWGWFASALCGAFWPLLLTSAAIHRLICFRDQSSLF